MFTALLVSLGVEPRIPTRHCKVTTATVSRAKGFAADLVFVLEPAVTEADQEAQRIVSECLSWTMLSRELRMAL